MSTSIRDVVRLLHLGDERFVVVDEQRRFAAGRYGRLHAFGLGVVEPHR